MQEMHEKFIGIKVRPRRFVSRRSSEASRREVSRGRSAEGGQQRRSAAEGGNADKGVGLWAGQVMLTVDNVNQYIDWWHEVLPGSGENFDHEGTLTSVVFSSGLTIGLTNYWNVTLTQIAGNRFMTWEGDTTTIHHRDEGSHEDFINAVGGLLGDTRILFRYLL